MDNKNGKRVKRALALIGAIGVLFGIASSRAGATSNDSDNSWFAWQPLAHSGFGPNGEFTEYPKGKITPEPSPTKLLDPVAIGLCNAGAQHTTIALFLSKYDGLVKLTCGNDNTGYVHIRTRHASQWFRQTPEYRNWDDFMVWSVAGILKKPELVTLKSGQKRCYSSAIKFVRRVAGEPVETKTIYPVVLVSMNNKLVITSYLTTPNKCLNGAIS